EAVSGPNGYSKGGRPDSAGAPEAHNRESPQQRQEQPDQQRPFKPAFQMRNRQQCQGFNHFPGAACSIVCTSESPCSCRRPTAPSCHNTPPNETICPTPNSPGPTLPLQPNKCLPQALQPNSQPPTSPTLWVGHWFIGPGAK